MTDTKPIAWTEKEFLKALRAAGWKKFGVTSYRSPDDPTVHFNPYEYRRYLGGTLWAYYAARRELPVTTRPPF